MSSSVLPLNLQIKVCRTIILPVVLYGCETGSLTLRVEHRLRVFNKGVFRRIFGSKREEVTGGWRKLGYDKLNDLFSSPNTVRVIKSISRWAGRVARMWDRKGVYRILVGKPEGKRPLGKLKYRWEYNTNVDLQKVEGGGVRIGLIWLSIGGDGRLL
jgi:hypothetical protein